MTPDQQNNGGPGPSRNPVFRGSKTASFLVAIDDFFAVSNVGDGESAQAGDLENTVELLWYTSTEERVSIGNMSSDFQASATLMHSLLEMHILADSAMPTLREAMRNNTCIDEIKITRVGHLGKGGDNTELYSSTFGDCYLESIEEFPDKLIIRAKVSTRSDTATATDFEEGQAGSTASGWDYSQNTEMAGN